jgi:hypothetical protein
MSSIKEYKCIPQKSAKSFPLTHQNRMSEGLISTFILNYQPQRRRGTG